VSFVEAASFDVYALGVLLLELLTATKQPPYSTVDQLKDAARRLLTHDPSPSAIVLSCFALGDKRPTVQELSASIAAMPGSMAN
jgi:hypothetical protein